MNFTNEQIEQIADVINTAGFKLIEKEMQQFLIDRNNLSRISGNSFEDGQSVGVVQGMSVLLALIVEIREGIKKMEEK